MQFRKVRYNKARIFVNVNLFPYLVELNRGDQNIGPIAQFVPNDIGNTVDNMVRCLGCSDTDILSWELPNGEILDQSNTVSNTLGAEVVDEPGSLTLSATGGVGTLPEGVYTCRIIDANGDEQKLFLYLLDCELNTYFL